MPVIPLKHVISFSSEDKNFPADNLLKPETYRKWKCKENGEKQVSVVLQFDKSYKIHSVDIGNESSALIEVLVGSSSDASQDFKVLLPTSSFMSPSESKANKNLNRVRMFDSDKLSKPVLSSKWDLVKVVCTQPFNKYTKYGISFVTFHSPPESKADENKSKPAKATQSTLKLGAFTLKPDDTQASNASPGSLFQKKKLDSSQSLMVSTPVQQTVIDSKSKESVVDTPPSLKKKQELHAIKSTKQASVSADQNNLNSTTNSQSKEKREKEKKNGMKGLKRSSSTSSADSSKAKKSKNVPSNAKDLDKKQPKTSSKPFDKLMIKVRFVLSGFQNPLRSEIRDKALEMGASYCSDWNSSSTHLICAFKNTPKYNIVKNKGGKIVKKDWIEECHQKEELLPWRSYGLGSNSHVPDTSEESESSANEDSQKCEVSDAEDTDDEILRAQQENKEKLTRADTTNIPLPDLPEIFLDHYFFLFGEFPKSTKKNLYRIITSFGGEIEAYMNENVNFIITESDWDSNFDDALTCNSQVKFLSPAWIDKCSQENKFVPPENFFITSS